MCGYLCIFRANVIDNSRYEHLCFHVPVDSPAALMHGLVGYFEAVLYKEVTLCTIPQYHTPNMSSWFPIFFPLSEPIEVAGGTSIDLHIWRCGAAHKVCLSDSHGSH